MLSPGAGVLLHAAAGCRRAPGGGDGQHGGGGLLRRGQVRGLPQGPAQHRCEDSQEEYPSVNWEFQGLSADCGGECVDSGGVVIV